MSRKPIRPQLGLPRVTEGDSIDAAATQRTMNEVERRLRNVEAASRDIHVLSGSIEGSNNSVWRYLGRQTLTSTTSGSAYTPTEGTQAVLLRMVGGGGQGGASYNAGLSSIGGGGAGGMYVEKWIEFDGPVRGGNFQCGTGGNGSIAANPGVAGTDTVIVLHGTTYVAKGGLGGSGSVWTDGTARGGVRQALSQAVDLQSQEEGQPGIAGDTNNVAAKIFVGGSGGGSPFGRGGGPQYNMGYGVGKHATGYGAGGGGITDTVGNTPLWGGSGSQGLIIIDEYK